MTGQRLVYPTDLSDVEWAVLAPLVPPPKPGGRATTEAPARGDHRGPCLWVRTDCAWRLLPHDFPPHQTVYHYWRQ
ncbi:transposase [Streptomyces sp. NPDC048155]|uniref:transposase n=1 Tax=Streptomyces sp. NPDC048155 TaxID=3154818 RepID=UPI0033C9A1FA